MKRELDYQRALGCLLGLAAGDALGMPSSFLTRQEISEQFGKIEDFEAPSPTHPFHGGLKAADVTDDTEQTLALARSFIRCRRVEPEDIVTELQLWAERVKGTYASPFGPSTQRALDRIAAGQSLLFAGEEGDTNGAAMRIAALGIIHGIRNSPLDECIRDTALACLPTHGTDVAISAAAAVSCGISYCFRAASIVEVLRAAEWAAQAARHYGKPVIAPGVAARIAWARALYESPHDVEAAVTQLYDLFGGGVLAADSVPIAVGLFALTEGDPRRAILLAANMGGDSDTIGAIAGALAGAYSGAEAVPAAWARTLEQVNSLELEETAARLVALAEHWQPVEEDSLNEKNLNGLRSGNR